MISLKNRLKETATVTRGRLCFLIFFLVLSIVVALRSVSLLRHYGHGGDLGEIFFDGLAMGLLGSVVLYFQRWPAGNQGH